MFDGYFRGLESGVEAVRRATCGEYHHRTLTIATPECLTQVALLGLGRQTRRGTATLHIDNHQWQLSHNSQTHSLRFEREAGTRGAGHCQVTCKRSTNRGADARNLVFSLHGLNAQVFALSEFFEDYGSGGDGVRAAEEGSATLLACSQQTPSSSLITIDIAIDTLR